MELKSSFDLIMKTLQRMGHKVSLGRGLGSGEDRYYFRIQLNPEWSAAIRNPQPLDMIIGIQNDRMFVYSKHDRSRFFVKNPKEAVEQAIAQVNSELYEMASEVFPREVVNDMLHSKKLDKKPDYYYDRNTGEHIYQGKPFEPADNRNIFGSNHRDTILEGLIRIAHANPELRAEFLPVVNEA